MKLNYGKPISDKLSAALRWNLRDKDYEEIASKWGYRPATARAITYGNAAATTQNNALLHDLLKRALENCRDKGLTLINYA